MRHCPDCGAFLSRRPNWPGKQEWLTETRERCDEDGNLVGVEVVATEWVFLTGWQCRRWGVVVEGGEP